ncbi:hypothetical protein F4780DRAFT_133102 [Xylariomycetidae sp. FL0641]|nr:hypothetical protein F4780DRAFT_133102 [Xylariomycetidae sp. FL0641]
MDLSRVSLTRAALGISVLAFVTLRVELVRVGKKESTSSNVYLSWRLPRQLRPLNAFGQQKHLNAVLLDIWLSVLATVRQGLATLGATRRASRDPDFQNC